MAASSLHAQFQAREALPVTQVDEIRPVLPELCRHCGHALPADIEQVQTTGEPQRHQVTELPPIQARTIEYQCHRVVCPECGESTRATLPEEAQGRFGPQLTALISLGVFLARFHKGSRFMLEQTRVNEEVWLPRQLAAKIDVRLALLKNFNVDIEQSYRDYRKFRTSAKIVGVGEVKP